MKRFPTIILILFAFAAVFAHGQPATQPARGPAFVIGAWAQPAGHFDRLKSIGVNTVVGFDNGGAVAKDQWEQKAADAGLWFVDVPGANVAAIAAEAKQSLRLAWQQDDEPDLNRWKDSEPADSANNSRLLPGPRYKGWTRPEYLTTRYAMCRAYGPDVPVFANFAGPSITNPDYTHGEGHKPYLAAADWIGFDWHIKNWDPDRYSLALVELAADRLTAWSGGKRLMVVIEVTQHRYPPEAPKARAPTPDEVEAMVDTAIARGATGIIYFCHTFKGGWNAGQFPNGWYGLTPEMEQRVRAINAKLHAKFNAPTTQPATQPATQPTTAPTTQPADPRVLERLVSIDSKLDRLLEKLDAPAGGPATQPAGRAFYDLNLAPIGGASPKATEQAMATMGFTPLWTVYNGTLNRSPNWSSWENEGRLFEGGAVSPIFIDRNGSDPPAKEAVYAVARLAKLRGVPIVFDIEGAGTMNVSPNAPRAQREAALARWVSIARWTREIVGPEHEVYIYGQPGMNGDDLDERELAGLLSGGCWSLYNINDVLMSDGAVWYQRVAEFEARCERLGLRKKVGFLHPYNQVYWPDQKQYAAILPLADKPVEPGRWAEQLDHLRRQRWDLCVWMGGAKVEPVKGLLEAAAKGE